MHGCFIYTYKRLKVLGFDLPNTYMHWNIIRDSKIFLVKYQWFLDGKHHYKFFESFCDYPVKFIADTVRRYRHVEHGRRYV